MKGVCSFVSVLSGRVLKKMVILYFVCGNGLVVGRCEVSGIILYFVGYCLGMGRLWM